MRTRFLVVLILAACVAHAQDFRRSLPDPKLTAQLTREKFPSADAVIILKEQLFKIHQATMFYRALEFSGISTVRSQNLIVKLLNEAGVKRYGTFVYEYREWFGDELPNGFGVRARVLKEDGTLWELPEDDVKKVVSRENADGDPLARKVMFTIPNLAAGDIVQIEYDFSEVLSRSYSGIFFYSGRDPILFSNLAITLPAEDRVRFNSFPEQRIGQPTVQQLSTEFGAGETYFWSVKNLGGVPDEPYARPLEEESPLTAFVVDPGKSIATKEITDWNSIAELFTETYLDKDGIAADEIERLGFSSREQNVTLARADSLYAALRKAITLQEVNSLYPLSDDIASVFKKKKGDASDLSYIFYTILRQWGQSPACVWIRDRREGPYEELVPSMRWFDRLGVLLTIDGKERLYDFDRSVPEQYDMPWFLNGVVVPVLSPGLCRHKAIKDSGTDADHRIAETHYLRFSGAGAAQDSLVYVCSGAAADHLRENLYALEPSVAATRLGDMMIPGCFTKIDSVRSNGIGEVPAAEICYAGESAMRVEPIDAFLSLKLKNHALRELRERLFSVHRVSDVRLDEPFSIRLRWNIPVPQGYAFVSGPEATTMTGPCRARCEISAEPRGSTVSVSATIWFPEMLIPRPQYPALISFLDASLAALEKDLVLGKVVAEKGKGK